MRKIGYAIGYILATVGGGVALGALLWAAFTFGLHLAGWDGKSGVQVSADLTKIMGHMIMGAAVGAFGGILAGVSAPKSDTPDDGHPGPL